VSRTGPGDPARDAERLPAADAERVLARAAELDAARQAGLSLAQLRDVAGEAGIAPAAFEAALAEVRGAPGAGASGPGRGAAPGRNDAPGGPAPWWVRVGLFGVVDRRAAKVFYWLFAAALVAVPLLTLAFAPALRIAAVVLALWLLFALWSTSRAIHWADRHGWDRLR
jgi:hypothetical protein